MDSKGRGNPSLSLPVGKGRPVMAGLWRLLAGIGAGKAGFFFEAVSVPEMLHGGRSLKRKGKSAIISAISILALLLHSKPAKEDKLFPPRKANQS
jgi:hypothetical protein